MSDIEAGARGTACESTVALRETSVTMSRQGVSARQRRGKVSRRAVIEIGSTVTREPNSAS